MDKTINIEITQGICSVDGQEPSEFTKSIMERVSKGEISPNEGTRLMNEHFQSNFSFIGGIPAGSAAGRSR